jgi:hypothetical protein
MTPEPCTALAVAPRPQRDLLAELQEETGEHPPAWRPAVGDVLVGTLLRYDRAPNLYQPGESAVVAVVKPDEGQPVAIWLGTVLADLFRRHRPQPGDRLGLKRLPDSHPRPGKKPYARFVLRVDDGGRALDDVCDVAGVVEP